jgi:hypothetical protein
MVEIWTINTLFYDFFKVLLLVLTIGFTYQGVGLGGKLKLFFCEKGKFVSVYDIELTRFF